MATQAAFKRLSKEYKDIIRSPPPLITAKPLESNILEWHALMNGPPDTPYELGAYWVKVVFPADYPYKPPSIRMLTPSGRFKPGERICLSYSDYHPESWQPGWSIATILNGLLSFMAANDGGAGTMTSSTDVRKEYARTSMSWNRAQQVFREVWPEHCAPGDESVPKLGASLVVPTPSSSSTPSSTPSPTPESPSSKDAAQQQQQQQQEQVPVRHRKRSARPGSPTSASAAALSATPAAAIAVAVPPPTLWQRYKAWLLVGCSLWLYLFINRLSARLSGAGGVPGVRHA